jgi:hypothetical protein
MRLTRTNVSLSCEICERSLLLGERAVRFQPYVGSEMVDVCALCVDEAVERGWIREGSPTTPTMPDRRRRRSGLARLLDLGGRPEPPPVVAEPILRRLSEPEQAMVEAAELFNASDHRRAVAGIARSLGAPHVSIVTSRSRMSGELVITIVWELSWYQYRVTPDSMQPVRLEQRGQDPGELDRRYTDWNAHLEEDGRVTPEISRI